MGQEANNVLHEIKEDLASIKTTLDSIMPTVDLKLSLYEEKLKVANNRIKDLEDTNKWMWRAIAGAIIGCIVAMYFK